MNLNELKERFFDAVSDFAGRRAAKAYEKDYDETPAMFRVEPSLASCCDESYTACAVIERRGWFGYWGYEKANECESEMPELYVGFWGKFAEYLGSGYLRDTFSIFEITRIAFAHFVSPLTAMFRGRFYGFDCETAIVCFFADHKGWDLYVNDRGYVNEGDLIEA